MKLLGKWREVLESVSFAVGLFGAIIALFIVSPRPFPDDTRNIIIVGIVVLLLVVARIVNATVQLRRRVVEREMVAALGLPPEPSPPAIEAADETSEADSSDKAGNEGGAGEPTQTRSSGSTNYEQHVNVTFSEERGSADLADLIKQQSDGHARLVIKYYAQGHIQASISFMLSMVFAVIGFAVIAIALIVWLRNPQQALPAGITGAVGVVNQAVGVLFFRRADKGRELMMQLIDKLRADRDSEMKFIAGLAAVDQVQSQGLRDALRASTALTFTNSNIGLDQLVGLMSSGALQTSEGSEKPPINIFGPQHYGPNGNEAAQESATEGLQADGES